LASTVFSLNNQATEQHEPEVEAPSGLEFLHDEEIEDGEAENSSTRGIDLRHSAKLRGHEARRWFAKQLMLPEWMIDVPDGLSQDWYVFARPAGKRCFVVSSNGTTVSRLRTGSVLHRFPSALPNGSKSKESSRSGQSYCILDCIFHELDQTYYVIDMVCWAGIPFYECTSEFRFFWLNNKLSETKSCDEPSRYNKYRFSLVPIFNCDLQGLQTAYSGAVSYVKDGLMFCNKHAHYEAGNTPLALVWKDETCSQYVIDTDSKGCIPLQQQVVLELQDDGSLTTSDDPPVVFGLLNAEFIQKTGLRSGDLLRCTVGEGGLSFVDGKLEKADLQNFSKIHSARAFADTHSKIMFQYMARHSPLTIEHLISSISSSNDPEKVTTDVEMDV
jgi:snurportin-1